ncbi:hypothetical protein IJG93_03640 [Candidatus Saccharibacteria bacterium]|nr:hypothetical protein [Candidatus Saccharibacteria bacterium]
MSNFKKKILSVSALTTMIVILITAIVASFAVTKNASAAMSVDEIYKNVMGNLIYKCYNDSEMYSTVSGADYNSTSDNADTAFGKFVLKGGSGLFYIPTGVGPGNEIAPSTSGGTRINCKQLFLGGDGISQGLFALFGKEKPSPHSSTLNTELKNIGYTKESGGSGNTTCINAYFGEVGLAKEEDSSAGSICWKDDEIAEKISWPDFVGAAKFTYSSNAVSVDSLVNSGAYGSYVGIKFKDTSTGHMCDVTASPVTAFSSRTWQDVINDLGAGSCTINNVGGVSYEIAFTVSRTGEGSEIFSDFSWLSPAAAANTAKSYFTGFNSAKTFTVEDRYELYKAYLNNVYGASYGSCKPKSELSDWRVPDATGATTYYVYYDGLYYNVSIPDDKKSLRVSSFGDDTVYMTGYWDLETLLQSIWNMNFAETGTCESGGGGGGGGGGGEPGMEKPGDVSLDSSGIVDCNQLENLGAMQWLLCPVMNNEQYTASWIDNMTQEWLEVDTDKLYKDDAVEKVWKNIRVIANVVMVVFLLVIIFSQVTGYGIDNYGVKKMLPRLIVMAIIINLSFVICQLAIDLSNIAGVGLRNMFTSISMTSGSEMAGTSFLGDMVMGLFASASTGGAAAVSGFTIAVTLGAEIAVAVVVAVIVLLLVILVAVMVLFLMLGAREIIIIVCIILSPLAFAAFILPNTQNLFKKWWELFKAALIIFPICGAMAGISNMLRGMYSTKTELHMWGYAVLMVLPYLGFFLMPMLLKNAISALGKVGGALTSLGNTVKNGGKAIGQGAMKIGQNTEAFKTMQAEAARRRQSESAQRTIDRMKRIQDKNGSLNDAQKRQLARAHEVQRKLGNEDTAAATILAEREYAGQSQEALLKDWETAFDSGDTGRMDALTNVITSRYGPGGVNSIAKRFDGKDIFDADGEFVGGKDGNIARSFAALQTNMMQNKGLATAMQNKASDVYQMISSGGYAGVYDANGDEVLGDDGKQIVKRQNLATHSAHNSMATQIKDWATQSSATLERAAANGALTPDTMREILESSDPAVQSGIKSDADKRKILEAGASGFSGNWKNKGAVAQAAQQYKSNVEHEREAKEYEQTWQTLLNQKEQAEMASNVSRIASAVSPQGGGAARATAAGAQNASLNAGAKATASGGATNSIRPSIGNSNTSAARPQVSAASSSPTAGGFGTSGNMPFANINNYTQAPQVPQGTGAQGTSGSRSVTPPQGGSIPRENSGAPKVDWNARARGDNRSDRDSNPNFGESGTNHGGPDSWTRSQTAQNDQAGRNNQNR